MLLAELSGAVGANDTRFGRGVLDRSLERRFLCVTWFAPREAIQHEENGGRDDCGAGRQIAGEYPG